MYKKTDRKEKKKRGMDSFSNMPPEKITAEWGWNQLMKSDLKPDTEADLCR